MFTVVVVTLSYHTVILLLRGNNNTINQLNLRNFSASVNYKFLLFARRSSRCTYVTSKVLSLFSKFTGVYCGKLRETSLKGYTFMNAEKILILVSLDYLQWNVSWWTVY